MSQKSVIVVQRFQSSNGEHLALKEMSIKVFADLKSASNHYGWVYNTVSRRGNFFIQGNYEVYRKSILRKGGEEKEKKKLEGNELP